MNRVSTGELARINQAMAKAGADAVKKRKEQEEQRKKYEEERQKAALEQSRIPNGGGSAWEQYRAAKAAGEVKNASEFIQKRDARNSAWNKIGVDTLEDDMKALSNSIGAAYGDTLDTSKYYTQEQLNASSNQVKQVRDRLQALQDYYNTYGGTDEQKKAVGDQIKAYDDEIQFFGDLANHYGSYKNEADFNYRNDKRLNENYLTYNYDINAGKIKLKDIESYLDVINGRNAGATHAAYERAKEQYGLDGMSASEIKNWLTQEYQLESFAVNNADRMRTAAGYKSLANSSDFTQGVLSGKATENPTFEDINAYQTELEQLSDKMTGRVGGGFTKEDEERYNYLKEHPVTINNKLRFYDDYNNGNGEYHASPLPAGATDYSGLDNDIKYAVNGNRDLLTDEEASTYYYLLGTKGADAANEYLDYMQTTLDFRNTEQVKQAIEEFKNNKHFRDISTAILNPATYLTHAVGITSDKDYEKVKDNTVNAIYSAISVPMNVIGGGIATIGDVSQRLSLISKGDWDGEGYNPYANYNLLAVSGQQARGLVAKDIEENTSLTLFGQNVCSQLYQSLMSGADSAFGMATLGKMYTVSMYGSAATSKAAELYESGASNSQIFYESMLSGIAEMTFEYLSLENLSSIKNIMEASPTTLKKAVKMILVQNGVEASEEVFTEIANTVIDEGIRKYDSDYNQKITEYVRDGMSRDEAVKKAAGEVASNITWAGIGGAFSGLASSSLTIMGSYSANKEMRNQQYSAIDPGTADGLVTNAKNIDLAILNDVSAAIKSGDTERAQEIISEGKDWYDSLKAYGKDKYGKTQGSEISASVDASIDNLNKISKLVAEGKIEASAIDGILANAKTSAETKDVVSENNEKLYSVLAKENISNKDIERNILKDKGTLAAFERLTGTKADGTTISQKRASVRQTIEAIKNTTETLKLAQNAIESGKTASEGRLNAVKILNEALEANKAENSQLRNSETAKSKETKEAIDRNVREYSFLRTAMNYVREGGDLSGFTNPPVANVSSETNENTAGMETSSETAKGTDTARPKNDGSAYSDDLGVAINIRDGQSPESAIAEEVREIDRTVQDIEDAVNMTEEEKTEQIDALKSRRSSLVTAYETLFDLNEMAKYAHGEDIERIAKELSKPLKKLGLKIETEENISAAEGQKSGAYFDKNTNTIHLSKNWGSRESVVHLEVNENGELVVNRDANVSFDRAVTQTVAHEIAHGDPALVKSFIKSIAGTSFDAFDFAGRLEHPNDSTWESSNKQKEQNWREYRDAYLAQEMSLMSDELSDDEKLTAAEKKVNDAYIYEEIMADMFGQAVDSVDKNGAAGDNVFVIMNRTEPKLIKRIVNALKRFAARLSGKEGYLNEVKRQQAERLQEVISRTLDRAYGDVGSVAESAKETGSGTENDGNRYSVAGLNSETADRQSLDGAISMYNIGTPMDTIRRRTGWWLGKDGKWRYEISDDKMRFNPDGFVKNPETVGDYVKHDQLFRAYPWIADVKVNMVDKVTGGTKETNGKYSFDGNFIELKNGMAPEKAKYVLAHELQHAVQYSEGFVHGTSPKTGMLYAINFAYDLVKNNPEFVAEKKPQNKMKYLIGYLEAKCGDSLGEIAKYYYFKNYGEMEARSVSKRLDMTEAERRAIPIENNGEIFSYENVFDATIDNLRAMGYNEKQIMDIMKKGVSYDIEQTNVQESDDEVGKRRRNDRGETGRLSEADTNRGETGEIYRSGEVSTTGVSEKAEVLDSGRRLGELRRGNGRTDISGASLGSGTESFQRLNEITKPEKRFSLTSTVEQTKDLIAVHNLTTSKLEKTLDLGGFPMPSIAIIKAADGHAEYGDVSVVFGKDTIDPQKSSRNKVYGGDAWTPTFPKIEYKANEKAEKRIRDKYYELSRKYGYDSTRALYNYATDLSSELDSAGGEKALKEKLYSDTGMMQIYLEDSGKGRVANVSKETKTTLTDEQVRQYDILIDTVGKSEMNKYAKHDGEDMKEVVKRRKEFLAENESAIRKAFEKTFIESGMSAKDAAEVSTELAMSDLLKYVLDTYNYMKNGKETIKSEFDPEATNAAIKKAADGKEYHEWVNKLFGGAEERSGIRNGKDPFTASGNRRSFEALHWETNLENIVSAMLEQDETGGAFVPGTGIFGASTKKFGSISDIKRDSARLRTISKADYSAMKEQFGQRMTEIARTLADPKADNYFLDNEYGLIVDAVRSRKTIDGIFNYLRKYNGRATEQTANDIAALVRDISEMPTGYFEAKPQRAVGFDEVKAVILPDNASDTLISRLRDDGVNTVTYPAGDENARLEALNGVENVRFSLTRANDEYMKAIKSGDEKTAQRLVDEAAKANGYDRLFWHGAKKGGGFTEFRDWSYFTENKEYAERYAKRDDNQSLYEVYAKLGNVFDTRDETCRKLFEEMRSEYGLSELQENGLPDWTDGYDIAEFIDENGLDYDSIILDEGGDLVDGKPVSRGLSYVIRSSEQVKSADAITYDNDGNVIPLTERFDSGKKDIRWSLAGTTDGRPVAVIDKDILDGVPESEWKSVARKAITEGFPDGIAVQGKNIRVNQTTRREYTKSDYTQWLFNHSKGVFADKMRAAANLDDVVLAVTNWTKDGGLKHPRKDNFVDFGRGNVLMSIGGNKYSAEVILAYPQVGAPVLYDVVTLNPDSFDLINEKAVSANANTAASGAHTTRFSSDISAPNIVSLSQNDLDVNSQSMQKSGKDSSSERHSLVKDSQKSVRTLERENVKLKQKISDLKQELKLTHGKKLSRDALLKNIQNLVAGYGSKIKADALYDDVTELYDIVYNRIVDGKKLKSVDEIPNYVIEEKLDKIADTIIEYAVERDTTYDEYADLLKELKRTKITVPRSNRADAGVEYGNTTWAEFRKRNFGKVAFTNTGIPIDSYYMELTERFPELFPDDITHPGEQAARIVDVVNTIKRGLKEELPIYDGRDERVSDAIKSDILDMLKNTDKLMTFADKAEQRVQDARLAERMHYGSELARVKRERDENVAKIKERYAEQMEKRSENQKKTVATQQIVRKVNEFTSLLKRPTQKNHVTEAFRKPLLDFLGSLDIVSKEYTAKQKKELASGAQVTRNVNLARQSTFDEIQRILLEAERDAQNDAGTNGNAVDETDINAQEKKYIVDSGVLSLMYEWNKKNYGKPLSEMSSEQLQELNTILNITKSVMANIKRIYDPTVGLAARSDVIQNEMKMSRWNERAQRLEAVKNWFRDKGDKYLNYPAMDAYRFYNLVDSPEFTKQLDSFRHAQDKFGTNVDTFLTMMEDAVGEKGIPESWHGKKAQEVTLDLSNGKLRATPAQIMTLYLLLQQEDSRNCLLNDRGGAVIGAYTAKGEVTEQKGDKVKKKNVRVFNKQNDPLVLTEADISKISGAMTPEMLECANKISKILSGKAAQLGNEVSMAMWGYKKYTTENYFPMRVFETGKPVVLDPKTEMNLLGLSLAKERTHYAGKPLIVEDIFDAVGRHLTNMAQYNAFAQVIDDARRMYTLRTGNGRSLKRLLVAQYGDKADNYYRNLLNNLSGAEITTAQGVEAFSDKLLSHYKAAAVAKNLSVVFKQPMSIFRAMPEFSSAGWKAWHSFKDASPTQVKAEMAEMLEHSGIAKLKNWGASENMTKKSFEELYNNTPKSWLKRANEKLDSGAEFADMWTWSRLWRMSKAEVEATGKYTKGSEEYFKAVNDKFSQVIGKTQVVQSALDSSAAVQNNSLFSKFFYAFQNEPLKQYNYLSSCIDDVRRGKKGAKAKLAKVVGMSVVNAVMTASISTFFALWRGTLDRDDDDEKWDDILKSVTSNAALDLVSGGLAPIWQIVETAISAIESGAYGNTVERMDLASLTDLGGLLNKYFISQSGGRPNLGTLQDIINVSSELFGWSGKNFLRDFKGGVDRVIFDRAFFGVDFSPKFKYNYLKLWKDVELTDKSAVSKSYYAILQDAVERGEYSDYLYIKRDMISHGYTDTKIKNAVSNSELMDDLYELKQKNPGSYEAKVNNIVTKVSALSKTEGEEFRSIIESAVKKRERTNGVKTDEEVRKEKYAELKKEVKERLVYLNDKQRAKLIKELLEKYSEYGFTEADIEKIRRDLVAGK